MDSGNNSSSSSARRSEDIALDLLKFVAAHTNLGRGTSPSTTGFGIPATTKPEDQIAQVLDLYARCRAAVESPVQAGQALAKK